jgi:hypothetical protein
LQPGERFVSTHFTRVASDPPGQYEAWIDYGEAGWPLDASTTDLMQEPSARQAGSWGQVKTLDR